MATKALSVECYHENHLKCPGKEHCGCDCHVFFEQNKAVDEMEKNALVEENERLKGQLAYLQERILEELSQTAELRAVILKLETRIAGYESAG